MFKMRPEGIFLVLFMATHGFLLKVVWRLKLAPFCLFSAKRSIC